jgi:signal transduction histidine kinase
LPVWLPILILIVSIALLMTVYGSFILKRQVNARTRELKKINAEMEQRIIDRTAELAQAMEKAKAADKIKSAFLATMSHELRTPLNSIIGFTGIMLQGLAGPLNEEQHKQLSMIQNSSRHLLSLINDVLDISKIEAGQLELSPNPFLLKLSIDKILKLISPLAEKKGLSLKFDITEDIGTINADQRRLEQVIMNLLNNAVKFTEKGNIHITCRTQDRLCILSVADTGIGMEQEEIPKLFQPFHQIDTGIARKTEGTGLGLSICKRILEMMNGSIIVQSEFGKGSIFTVSFPLHAESIS